MMDLTLAKKGTEIGGRKEETENPSEGGKTICAPKFASERRKRHYGRIKPRWEKEIFRKERTGDKGKGQGRVIQERARQKGRSTDDEKI